MTKARQLADLGNAYDDGALSNRNMVTNGAMQVAQRGTSVSTSSTGYKTVDRFYIEANGSTPTVTMSQDTASTPDTFTQALKLQVTSTATPSGFNIAQKIEGYNFSSAGFGKTTTKNITLSFWVRSSITGTYSTSAMNSTANRSYVSEYIINTADTWEKKTITIDGDTTGTWPSTSGMSLQLFFCLDNDGGSFTTSTIGSWIASNKYAGSTNQVNWAGTNGATFYITGVQLEVGDTATPFEHRSYGDELAKCQRYTFVVKGDNSDATGFVGYSETTSAVRFGVRYPVAMRASPSFALSGSCRAQGGTTDTANFSSGLALVHPNNSHDGSCLRVTGTSGAGAADRGFNLQFTSDGASLTFDAEL